MALFYCWHCEGMVQEAADICTRPAQSAGNDSDINYWGPAFTVRLCRACWECIGREKGWTLPAELVLADTVAPDATMTLRVGDRDAPTPKLREDAVFAKGYRAGHFDAGGATAFQSEVDAAHERWVAGGRKTHLDEGE